MNRMNRREFLRWAGVTAGAATLASCVPAPAPAPAGEVAVPAAPASFEGIALKGLSSNIRYAMWLINDGILDEFKADTGISIELDTVSFPNLLDQGEIELSSGGDTYDVMMMVFIKAIRWMRPGWVTNLDPYIERDADEVDLDDLLPATINSFKWEGSYYGIPYLAESTQTMYRTWVLDEPVMLNSFRGHMHLHGIAMSIEVVWPGRVRDYYGPGANRRDVIASINNYNHNWQTSFVFADDARPILPAGTAIVMRTHFDNTENNPLSIDPDQWVVFGGRSVDAMSHFHVSVTYLEEEEYDSLLVQRFEQLAGRKARDGEYGTALLAIHPDERIRLETGHEAATVAEPSRGVDRYSQQ